jgi:cyclophilin family peptidyl-prolyl cis-trans isomerase
VKKVVLYLGLVMILIGCKESKSSSQASDQSSNNKKNTVMNDSVKTDSSQTAVIETNMGTIKIALLPNEAPKAVENFVGLAKKGYYNGIIFHRVIDNFMIQGGDPTGTGRGGESIWGGYFNDEISPNLKFDKPGVVAMANAGPNTNGSQFFITVVPTPWLNGHYTIFGKVISGMDIVNKIDKVPTSKPNDKPLKDVVMQKVTIENGTAGENQ